MSPRDQGAPETNLRGVATTLVTMLDRYRTLLEGERSKEPQSLELVTVGELAEKIVEKLARGDPPTPAEIVDRDIKDIGEALGSLSVMQQVAELVEEIGGSRAIGTLDHRWDGVHGWWA